MIRRPLILFVLLWTAGCSGNPSALDPAGPAAKGVASLTWVLVGTSLAVYILTLAVFFWSMRRGASASATAGDIAVPLPERGKSMLVGGALVATTAVLTVLVGVSTWTDRASLPSAVSPRSRSK